MEKKSLFYLIFPVGLSELGVIELKTKWSLCFPELELKVLDVEAGGALIEVPILHGFLLNNLLKTPTRILMRIAEFKVRDFPKLYQKASKFPWNEFLMGQLPSVEVAAHESRLFDSRKIEKAIHDGMTEFYRRQPIKKRYQDAIANASSELPKIYYRAIEDNITLSIDTTGERLHKRGEKLLTGLAPIRENLATLLLLALTSDLSKKTNREIIDPMCGSGTFLLEAKKYFKPANDRNFAYEFIPDWFDSQLKKQLIAKLNFESTPLFDKFLGNEIDEKVVRLALENLADPSIEIVQGDAFTFKREITPNVDRFVILNPPYGIRVGDKSEINSAYYQRLVNSLVENLKPKRLGIIIPEEYNFIHKNIRSMRAFKNGGIDVVFYILEFSN